ncbi:hypothetical protein D9757_007007 [Collybiopsis confluens]|uniref:T6SS Phospholipase effector Tle1-like catalytic domain-containing protein n=1 Tax=Collybiopsis confluens TaxID=2823264 RepID=A0A8H5HCD1_9AGAR|nr:hypothetical protein D9757_007007 [Collybiopsis confluens]
MSPNPRTLVLCFDGTSNEYDSTNTNVVKFFSLLKKDNTDGQLCYYQAGVGTFFAPGVVSPLFQWFAKILDEAVAWYLNAHVMDGYNFLMQNYRAGDEICLFGFSRGAYTARALAGMLYKIGLLPRDNQEQVPFAYKLYTKTDQVSVALSAGFKKTLVDKLMWECITAGTPMTKDLPFTSDNDGSIKVFRQALSLDEVCRANVLKPTFMLIHWSHPFLKRRVRFKPNFFHRDTRVQGSTSVTSKSEVDLESSPTKDFEGQPAPGMRRTLSDYFYKRISKRQTREFAHRAQEQIAQPTDVLECWFAGCHSDIGGGAVPNATKQSLANITLRWMVHHVKKSECGIQFNEAELTALGISPSSIPTSGPSKTNTSTASEAASTGGNDSPWRALATLDASQPLDDQLVKDPAWWILEILPMRIRYQDASSVMHTTYRWNLGRGRQIYGPNPYFHITVKERLADKPLAYKPKAQWPEGTQIYVE